VTGNPGTPGDEAVTGGLAARCGLWADLVVRDPDVRWYLPLHRSSSCDVWLPAWERGQDTDWHDHGGSSGSFAVAEGCPVEQCRAPGGRRIARRRRRLDPRSEARIPALARADAPISLMCSEGYASTLATATFRRIGLREATDLDGGFQAWKAAGLPTRPAQPPG
jgi:rhodanese-related sulfurtransferase